MNYSEDFGYMSIIETISDVNNSFLSRREIICNFAGLGGNLNKLEAIDMITKEFKLDGKLVIPMRLKNHVGKPLITGTFFVYDDENLSKTQINPTIFTRLEKAKKAITEKESQDAEASKEETETIEAPKEETKSEEKPEDEKKEGKSE
jgi:ribosomal protein S24E